MALLLALAAALALAACGGSSEETNTVTVGDESVEIEGDVPEDPFEQLRFVLAKFPYKSWYRDCLVAQVEAQLSREELEELAQLPDERARQVALRYALGASPKCEQRGRKPIDPGADEVEVQLLRLGYASTLEALGKREGLDSDQAGCLSATISKFDDAKVIELGNAAEGEREAILVAVIESCAS